MLLSDSDFEAQKHTNRLLAAFENDEVVFDKRSLKHFAEHPKVITRLSTLWTQYISLLSQIACRQPEQTLPALFKKDVKRWIRLFHALELNGINKQCPEWRRSIAPILVNDSRWRVYSYSLSSLHTSLIQPLVEELTQGHRSDLDITAIRTEWFKPTHPLFSFAAFLLDEWTDELWKSPQTTNHFGYLLASFFREGLEPTDFRAWLCRFPKLNYETLLLEILVYTHTPEYMEPDEAEQVKQNLFVLFTFCSDTFFAHDDMLTQPIHQTMDVENAPDSLISRMEVLRLRPSMSTDNLNAKLIWAHDLSNAFREQSKLRLAFGTEPTAHQKKRRVL
jgi:hypothetical protein